MRDFLSTAASALPGHPDKLCDWISDAVIDATLAADAGTRITAECALASGIVFLACHETGRSGIDHGEIVRGVIEAAGYRAPHLDPHKVSVMVSRGGLDPAPWDGVPTGALAEILPASNNVSVFGYACRQSPDFLPRPIALAHDLARKLWSVREKGGLPGLLPDGQVQVCLAYQDRRPVRVVNVTAIVAGEKGENADIDGAVHDLLAERLAALDLAQEDGALMVNPDGTFLVGGPARHPGLTGRKTAMDTYGDHVRHGGAALSGKDPTRIDRIGAYAARAAALSIVAAGLAEECEVQISYAVGRVAPLGIEIDTYGSGGRPDTEISAALRQVADLRPGAILDRFALRDPALGARGDFFASLSAFGQVGQGPLPRPWEEPVYAEALAAAL